MTEVTKPQESNSETIARNSLLLIVDTLVGVVTTLVSSIAVARVMGPEKLGYYNYVLWIASMTRLIASMGIPAVTRKYAAEYLGKGQHDIVRAIVRATFKFQAVVAAVVVAGGLVVVLFEVAPERRTYAFLAVCSLAPSLLRGIPTGALDATENLRPNVLSSLVSQGINFLGILLTLVLDWDLPGLAGSLFASRVVDFGLRYVLYRRIYSRFPVQEGAPALPREIRARMVSFCWQVTILLPMQVIVWDRGEMIFLERMSNITEVAYFSLGFNIVTQLLMLPRILADSTGVTLMAQQGRDPARVAATAATSLRFTALFSFPLLFGAAAIGPELLHVLYGERYLLAIPAFAVIAIGSLGRSLMLPAQPLLLATENQRFLLGSGFLLVVFNVALDLWWIPEGGALGAAYAKGVVQTVGAAALWGFAGMRLGLRLPYAALLRLLGASLVMFAVVRATTPHLPGVAALVVGVPLGAVVFLLGIRVFRALEMGDKDRLLRVERVLPRALRGTYRMLLTRLVA